MPHQVCVRHSGLPVAWRCGPCNKDLCRECVVVAGAGDAEVSLCPFCGHPCRRVAEVGFERREIFFFAELRRVPGYPIKGHGRYIIVAWAVFWAVAGIVSFLLGGMPLGAMSVSGGVLPLLPFVFVMVATSGHLSAYCLEIIAKSADGEETPPDWPDIKDW